MLIIVLLIALGLSLFIYSMFLFQGKGPVPTTQYILAKPEERKRLKNKDDYRFTGIIMLVLSVIYSLAAVGVIFTITWMYIVIISICVVLVVYVVAYSIREEKKGKSL